MSWSQEESQAKGPSPAVAQTRSLFDPTAEKPPLFSQNPNAPKTNFSRIILNVFYRLEIEFPTCMLGITREFDFSLSSYAHLGVPATPMPCPCQGKRMVFAQSGGGGWPMI